MTNISLQKQLIKSTIITTSLLGVLGFFLISFILMFDDNNLFDNLLKANATSLLSDNITDYPKIEHGLQHLNEQMDIEYQVINRQGVIINKTFNAPNTAFILSFNNDEYYNIYANGRWWRIYVLYYQDRERFVQIAQPYSQRMEFVFPKIFNYFLGLITCLLVLLTVNSWVIKKSLKPLTELTNSISQKHLQELSPIVPKVVLNEILPLITAINELFLRLKNATLAQERFVADASHELRTPLAGIQMKLQLLERQFADNTPLTGHFVKLRTDCERAVSLVENLLMLARLDTMNGINRLSTAEVLVGAWLPAVVTSACDGVSSVQLVLGESEQVAVAVNLPLMSCAIHNLINNALRYGGAGVRVLVAVSCQNNWLTLVVKDDGIGVSEADRARLGERFFRVLGNTATGSGLGLSIVHKIVEQHGGRLVFEKGLPNTVGGFGFGVVIQLPIIKTDGIVK